MGEHLPIHPSRALESMRNSDFDTKSAIGEAIDNSLEADATRIEVRINRVDLNEGQRGAAKWRADEIAIGDDGHGMDNKTLERCLQLGFSRRYNDRNGIGRFGVGVTLGTISQCRRIELYSKEPDGEWSFTYLDLDEVEEAGEEAKLPDPKHKQPPKRYVDLTSSDHGTLVIWKKIDRAGVMNDRKLEEFSHWIGRTYRKWVADESLQDRQGKPPELVENDNWVAIRLFDGDDELDIDPYDPLYAIPYVEGDPRADLVETIELEIPVDEDIADQPDYPAQDTVKIRMSLLPEELRKKKFSSTREGRRRKINKNHCGISILRNGREVFYGSYLSFMSTIEGPDGFRGREWARLGDRYWGAEIEFPATLDSEFRVRNVKVGAQPTSELADKLREAIAPTVQTFREEIVETWDRQEQEEREDEEEESGHKEAEEVTEEIPTDDAPPEMEGDEKEKERLVEKVLKKEIQDLDQLTLDEIQDEIGHFNIQSDSDMHPRGPFIDIQAHGGKTVIYYASRHPFFKLLENELEKVESESDDDRLIESVRNLRTAIDLLLIAYAESYKKVLSMKKDLPPSTFLEQQVTEWTNYLKRSLDHFQARKNQDDV